MNLITTILKKIAAKFGLTLQDKADKKTDYYEDISLTATLCEALTTMILIDSDCEVTGNSARAKYLNSLKDYIWNDRLSPACVTSLGTGDCLLKPNTDGENISVDIIPNENFVITESIGNIIKGVIILCDSFKKNNNTFQRYEYQRLIDAEGVPCVLITQYAFRNESEVPLSSVSAWADIQEQIIIPNVDRLMLGRLKCPTVNRAEPNSVNGVPLTYGAESAISYAKDSYNRFNQEYSDKETIIFARKWMFRKDKDGEARLPRGKNNIVAKLSGINDGDGGIDIYSPDIRDGSLLNGYETNLKMIETLCGLSNNVLTKPNESYRNTTDLRNSQNKTYAYMTKYRGVIEKAIKDLYYAINCFCNVNNITPMGEYTVSFGWSDEMIEDTTEAFNQRLQLLDRNDIEDAEVRAWVTGESLDVARQRIAEIKEKNPTDIMVL